MGTYQLAMVAKTLKKPFYVAVESYKFARMYPLTQRDIRDMCLSGTYDCNKEKEGGKEGGKERVVSTESSIGVVRSNTEALNENIFTTGSSSTNINSLSISHTNSTSTSNSISNSMTNLNLNLNSNNTSKIEKQPLHRVRSQSLVSSQIKTFDHLNLTIDFTPAEFITLLFTDLGVLTPAAVSDELIRLYQ